MKKLKIKKALIKEIGLRICMVVCGVLALRNIFGVGGNVELGIWQGSNVGLMWLLLEADKLIQRMFNLMDEVQTLNDSLLKTLSGLAEKMGAHFQVVLDGKKLVEVGKPNERHNSGVEVENGKVKIVTDNNGKVGVA